MIITAAGYVINDVLDYKIDQINRPQTIIIGRKISLSNGWKLYGLLNGLGFILSLGIAYFLGRVSFVFIYFITVFLLWLYSYALKTSAFIGNLVVALFCAFVPGVIWFAEREAYSSLYDHNTLAYQSLIILIGGYCLFAFFSTLLREIIKDLEDQDGDAQLGAKTLPILLGNKITKFLASIFGIILLGIIYNWVFHESVNAQIKDILFLALGVAAPTIYILFNLAFAKSKKHFHHLSQVTKGIMLMGLAYLVIWFF